MRDQLASHSITTVVADTFDILKQFFFALTATIR